MNQYDLPKSFSLSRFSLAFFVPGQPRIEESITAKSMTGAKRIARRRMQELKASSVRIRDSRTGERAHIVAPDPKQGPLFADGAVLDANCNRIA